MKVGRIEIALILFSVLLIGSSSLSIVAAVTYQVTVTTDKLSYEKEANVGISGVLTGDGKPVSGWMLGIEIRNPINVVLTVLLAETGSDGVYSAYFKLPPTAGYGTYQVYVAVSGTDVKGSTSFDVSASPPPDTTPPSISNVAVSVTTTSATIEWTTDEPADGQIEYGTTASYGSASPLVQALDVSHSVILSGLAPSTIYHFRVKSTDGAGNRAQSGDFTFATLAQASTTSTSTTSESTTFTSTPEFSGDYILLIVAAVSTVMIYRSRKRGKKQER